MFLDGFCYVFYRWCQLINPRIPVVGFSRPNPNDVTSKLVNRGYIQEVYRFLGSVCLELCEHFVYYALGVSLKNTLATQD